MLVAIGDLLEEIVVRLEGDPVRGADTRVRSIRVRGGSAANVAAIDAERGGKPRFIGNVGDDALGQLLATELAGRGVDTQITHTGSTGVIVTTVGRGGRSRLIDRTSATRVTRIEPELLDDASQLYLAASAFADDPLASAVDQLMADVRDRRIPVTIGGPGSADLDRVGAEPFLEMVRAVGPDAVVCNRDEHAALGLSPREPIDGATATVITAGNRPTLVLDPRGKAEPVAVAAIEAIRDRTGVGDAFLAGFLASRRAGADAVSACNAGHRVAARSLSHFGPTTVG